MTAGVFCAAVAPVALSAPAHAQGTCTTTGPTTTCTFAFTGAEQTFTVPAGVTQVDVTAIGAAGGLEALGGASGGRGAQVSGTLAGLSGGQTLYVEVGGTATDGSCYPNSLCVGGFNGGGSSRFGGGGGTINPLTTPAGSAGGGGGGSSLVPAGAPAPRRPAPPRASPSATSPRASR
ncbi:hypothetical protein [Kitasatospora sp. NPDC085464]|uniref:glycine-rich domain-containing protein n=1 Tax=Kitasatospora sp. NPDC085464 TaxID=3364063 RepID=UPI0037CCB896